LSFLTFLAPKRVRDSELAFPDSMPPDQWMKESRMGQPRTPNPQQKSALPKLYRNAGLCPNISKLMIRQQFHTFYSIYEADNSYLCYLSRTLCGFTPHPIPNFWWLGVHLNRSNPLRMAGMQGAPIGQSSSSRSLFDCRQDFQVPMPRECVQATPQSGLALRISGQ
jgi:hypothetical protein